MAAPQTQEENPAEPFGLPQASFLAAPIFADPLLIRYERKNKKNITISRVEV